MIGRVRKNYAKNAKELNHMRTACDIAAKVLAQIAREMRPGVVLKDVDEKAEKYICETGATPAFKGYNGFPASTCISLNEQLIHGIPDYRTIADGDIVSVDLGVKKNGYYGDVARTFIVGTVPDDVRKLVATVKDAFHAVCNMLKAGVRVGDISHTIQAYAEKRGYGIVREYVGHGIGRELHEAPQIPNFGYAHSGARIPANATIAIEPMITLGDYHVHVCDDKWTVVTADRMPCAHYENTVLVTDNGCEILTNVEAYMQPGD